MKNIVLGSILILSLFFIFGCGTNPTGGGGGGIKPWIYINNYADNTISIINGTTHTTLSASIELGTYSPCGMAATLDGRKIYCSVTGTSEVLIIDTQTKSIMGKINLGVDAASYAMATSLDGKYVYMATYSSMKLFRIYTATNTFESVIPGPGVLPTIPESMALAPDQNKAVIVLSGTHIAFVNLNTGAINDKTLTTSIYSYLKDVAVKDNNVYVVEDVSSGEGHCYVLSTTTEVLTQVLTSDAQRMEGIVDIPGKDKMYVANRSDNEIRIINTAVPTFESGAITGEASFIGPERMAARPDGKYVYVYDGIYTHSQICVVDTDKDKIIAYCPVGKGWDRAKPVVVYK